MENNNNKIRVWICSNNNQEFSTGSKTLVFNIKEKELYKLMLFVNEKHSIWTMAIVYSKMDKKEKEIIRYYNFPNKKTFPSKNGI